MNRRQSLAAGAAALAGALIPTAQAAAQPATSDRHLLQLCAEFQRHHATAINPATPNDATYDAAFNAMWAAANTILVIRPTTPDGFAAKASVASALMMASGDCEAEVINPCDLFAMQTLHEVAGGAGPVVVPASVPEPEPLPQLDAELIAASAEFLRIERTWLAANAEARESERARLSQTQEPLLDILCRRKARTLEGVMAVARAACISDLELQRPDNPDDYENERLITAVFRSLTPHIGDAEGIGA